MKKIYTLFAFIAVTTAAQAQIPNAGFENWTSSGTYSNPNSWNSSNSLTAGFGIVTCEQGSPGAVGSSYLKLTTKTFATNNIPGLIASNSNVLGGLTPGFACASRPQNLTGQYQYLMTANDSANITIFLSKWDVGSMSRITVGVGDVIITAGSVTSWTNFSVPINYVTLDIPDSAVIFMTSSISSSANIVANDYLYVDDLGFSGTVPAGIAETEETNFTLAPNPSSTGIFRITNNNLQPATINVYNVTGACVYKSELKKSNAELNMDLSNQPKGIYFVQVQNNNKLINKKIVIE